MVRPPLASRRGQGASLVAFQIGALRHRSAGADHSVAAIDDDALRCGAVAFSESRKGDGATAVVAFL
jgi:hypothetical protein